MIAEKSQSHESEIRELIGDSNVRQVAATGSRVICPVGLITEKTDYDFLVHVDDLVVAIGRLIQAGFSAASSLADGKANSILSQTFVSLEKDGLNIIATSKTKFFDDFQLATRVAMKLGLNEKSQRITLFQAILYGNG